MVPLLTLADASTVLGISECTLRLMVRDGDIPHYRVGQGRGLIRFSSADLEAYLAGRRVGEWEKPINGVRPKVILGHPLGKPSRWV